APLQILLQKQLSSRWIFGWGLVLTRLVSVGGWVMWRLINLSPWAHQARRVFAAARECFRWNRQLISAVFLAFAVHILNFSIVYAFARSLEIGLTYGQVLLMMPVILFIVMIPITINGHGLRELLLIGYFGAMGVAIAGHSDLKV